jgi:hypothetical protein
MLRRLPIESSQPLVVFAAARFAVAVAALVFALIARFGDLPRLLGAMSSDEK